MSSPSPGPASLEPRANPAVVLPVGANGQDIQPQLAPNGTAMNILQMSGMAALYRGGPRSESAPSVAWGGDAEPPLWRA